MSTTLTVGRSDAVVHVGTPGASITVASQGSQGLAAHGIFVWDGAAYTISEDSPLGYVNIVFIDTDGTHDPTSSSGGREVDGDRWVSSGADTYAPLYAEDTDANLAAANAVYAKGRLIRASTSGTWKLGDGTTAYNSLYPLRTLAPKQRLSTTTQQTLITTEVDITGLSSITFTVTADCPWRVELYNSYVLSVGGACIVRMSIADPADASNSAKAYTQVGVPDAGLPMALRCVEEITTPGTYTREGRIMKVAGAGTSITSLINFAGYEAYIEARPNP